MCRVWVFLLLSCRGTQADDVISSPADCWDVMSEGDSSCHRCQTAQPAAYQTAGYSVTADMLNRPLKRNGRQPYRCLTVTHQRASNVANWTPGDNNEKFYIYCDTIVFLPSIMRICLLKKILDHMWCRGDSRYFCAVCEHPGCLEVNIMKRVWG